jgi:hypothetical protein
MHQKKVISETSLTNMTKSGKSVYFRHVFANNFFGTFLKTFLIGFEISVKFCVFDTHIEFLKKTLFLLFFAFFLTLNANGHEMAQKTKKHFL